MSLFDDPGVYCPFYAADVNLKRVKAIRCDCLSVCVQLEFMSTRDRAHFKKLLCDSKTAYFMCPIAALADGYFEDE